MQRPCGRKKAHDVGPSGGWVEAHEAVVYRWGKAGGNSELGTVQLSCSQLKLRVLWFLQTMSQPLSLSQREVIIGF